MCGFYMCMDVHVLAGSTHSGLQCLDGLLLCESQGHHHGNTLLTGGSTSGGGGGRLGAGGLEGRCKVWGRREMRVLSMFHLLPMEHSLRQSQNCTPTWVPHVFQYPVHGWLHSLGESKKKTP